MRFSHSILLLPLFSLPLSAQEVLDARIYYGNAPVPAEGEGDAGGLVGLRWSGEDTFTAIEAEYTPGAPVADHPIAEGRSTARVSVLAGVTPGDGWSVYGRLGLQQDAAPASSGVTETWNGIHVGLGAEYVLGSGLSARAEFDRQVLDSAEGPDAPHSTIRFGLVQNF